MRTLDEIETAILEECLSLAGVLDLEGLKDFCERSANTDCGIEFEEPRLLNDGFPAPAGKLRETFIFVVNCFIKYAHDMKTYPLLPASLSQRSLAMKLASFQGTTTRTAMQKLAQLVSVGWIENRYGNMADPIALYYRSKAEGRPHPGIPRKFKS